MTLANKLIVLRERFMLSQQYVADTINVSKSTYCRFEKGSSTPGAEEIQKILKLYSISYEEFMGIDLPIEQSISYPEKLLSYLRDAIYKNSDPVDDYRENYNRYCRIKDALEPVLAIRDEAMNFPDINVEDYAPKTIVKKVYIDVRGDRLIEEAMKTQHALFESMLRYFDRISTEAESSK